MGCHVRLSFLDSSLHNMAHILPLLGHHLLNALNNILNDTCVGILFAFGPWSCVNDYSERRSPTEQVVDFLGHEVQFSSLSIEDFVTTLLDCLISGADFSNKEV